MATKTNKKRTSKFRKVLRKIKNTYLKLVSKIHIKSLNIILIVVFIFFLWFNHRILEMFEIYQSIPSEYAVAVVVATIGEAGLCGSIMKSKIKLKEKELEEDTKLKIADQNIPDNSSEEIIDSNDAQG